MNRDWLLNIKSRPRITRDILNALEKKHGDPDVWCTFQEVQPGSRYFGNHRASHIIDFVAIKKSWTNFVTIGVEVKSCRADFKSDKKWQNYPQHFDKFYLACPRGVIDPDELIEGVGLLTWSNKKALRAAVKAEQNPNRGGTELVDIGLVLSCLWGKKL